MKKIPSLFCRNYDTDRKLRDELVPGTEWVVAGEGVATRKYDGTCCLVRDGKLWRRYDAKPGKTPPAGWEPAMDGDPVTGHRTGWVHVGEGPADKWHAAAFAAAGPIPDGTYELCGPHFQTNPEGFDSDVLVPHLGAEQVEGVPRTFDGLREFLRDFPHEGIVWHRDPALGTDGDMVKIKRRDFWPKEGA